MDTNSSVNITMTLVNGTVNTGDVHFAAATAILLLASDMMPDRIASSWTPAINVDYRDRAAGLPAAKTIDASKAAQIPVCLVFSGVTVAATQRGQRPFASG